MKRVCLSALFAAALAIAATWPPFVSVEAAPSATPTFNKDVLPVLQKQCQECHRPNSIAPMSFMTYKDTRPYARAIEKAVVSTDDAAVVCRSDRRAFQEHETADRRRDRVAQRMGEEWRAGRRPEGQARAGAIRGRVDDREARHRRPVSEGHSAARRRASSTSPTWSCGRTSRRTCG